MAPKEHSSRTHSTFDEEYICVEDRGMVPLSLN